MKKTISGIILTMIAAIGIAGIAGCKLTDDQVKIISKNAGLGAAVTWIAYDNPDTNATALVKDMLKVVSEKASGVQTGVTYTAAIYPEIEKLVATETFPKQYKSIVLAGSLAMLNGIDLLFALNPEWKAQEKLALNAVTSFCDGAKLGLTLSGRDPVIIQANDFSTRRAKIVDEKITTKLLKVITE